MYEVLICLWSSNSNIKFIYSQQLIGYVLLYDSLNEVYSVLKKNDVCYTDAKVGSIYHKRTIKVCFLSRPPENTGSFFSTSKSFSASPTL